MIFSSSDDAYFAKLSPAVFQHGHRFTAHQAVNVAFADRNVIIAFRSKDVDHGTAV